jgi:small GTP-binding protein
MTKCILVGNYAVGKSTLLDVYVNRKNPKATIPSTIGAAFATVDIGLEQTICLNVWDTAGEERFRSMMPMYFRHTDLILLVIDLSSESSIRDIVEWKHKIESHTQSPILTIANKKDLIEPNHPNHSLLHRIDPNAITICAQSVPEVVNLFNRTIYGLLESPDRTSLARNPSRNPAIISRVLPPTKSKFKCFLF